MSTGSLSRRLLMRLVGTALASAGFTARAEEEKPSDRGIGGTGIARDSTETLVGFVGTIRRFGSIFVNGERISYDKDVRVLIDGREAGISDLRIGQVVNVVATERGGAYRTREIVVMHEVVGPVEDLDGDTMKVLGQVVVIDEIKPAGWMREGIRVAVSGLRRSDGVIVASDIERSTSGPDQVIGVPRDINGQTRIGALPLYKLDPRYLDRRALVQSQGNGRRFVVISSTPLNESPPGVTRMSVEAFVMPDGQNIKVGNDLVARGAARDFKTKNGKAVFGLTVEQGGRLRINSVQMVPQSSRRGDARSGARPRQHSPNPRQNGGGDPSPTRSGSPGGGPGGGSLGGGRPGAGGPDGGDRGGNDGGDGDGGRTGGWGGGRFN